MSFSRVCLDFSDFVENNIHFVERSKSYWVPLAVFACPSDLYSWNFAQSADMLEGSRQHTDANETQSRTQPYLIQCVSQILFAYCYALLQICKNEIIMVVIIGFA